MSSEPADVLLIRSDIKHLSEKVEQGFQATNRRLDIINGTVKIHADQLGDHRTRLTVIETFCADQVKPLLAIVNENKTALAVTAAKFAGGTGGVAGISGIVFLIGKSQGWW